MEGNRHREVGRSGEFRERKRFFKTERRAERFWW